MTTLRRITGGSRLALASATLAAALTTLAPTSLWARTTATPAMADSAAMKIKPAPLLSVSNSNWLDVHVYLVRDGDPFSLGVVTGPGQRILDLPSMAMIPGARVQILVLPIGGNASYLSPALTIDPGDVIRLNVENSLPLSTAIVEPGS